MRCFALFLLALLVMEMPLTFGARENQLSYYYYKSSCPNLETIIKREMLPLFLTDASAPAAFLRLMFHDCQVQVIDFSSLTPLHQQPNASNFTFAPDTYISSIFNYT